MSAIHVDSQVYFGWLGWVLLALLVVVMVLVVLGVRPFGIRPHRARPIVATTAFLALVAHFGMLIDLDAVGADLGVAVWTVTLGFLASAIRSEEHTSELQSLMRNSYAVFCLKKTK